MSLEFFRDRDHDEGREIHPDEARKAGWRRIGSPKQDGDGLRLNLEGSGGGWTGRERDVRRRADKKSWQKIVPTAFQQDMKHIEPEGALMLVHSSCRTDGKHTAIRVANAWDDAPVCGCVTVCFQPDRDH